MNNIKILSNKCQLFNRRVILSTVNRKLLSFIKTTPTLRNKIKLEKSNLSNSTVPQNSKLPERGPTLKDFIISSNQLKDETIDNIPYLSNTQFGQNRKVFFDIYGCQMNFSDTEIIWSILRDNGYLKTDNIKEADVVLVVTCAIREGAESKIWNKINNLKGLRNAKKTSGQMKIGILGCMAERLKHKMLEKEQAIDLG